MSIDASLACFEHDGREINLIDTPGEPSFVADAIAALRVADAAVVVVNGVAGVEVNTERLWRRADAEGLARLVFVNMLDRERADFFAALDSLKAAFGPHVVATEIPIGAEQEVRGVVDLIDMRAFLYEGDGRGGGRGGRDPGGAARAGRGVPREADGRGRRELRRADGALPRGRGDRPRRDRRRRSSAGSPRAASSRSPAGSRRATSAPAGCSRRSSRTCPRRRCAGAVMAPGAGGEAVEIEPDEDGPLVAYVFKTLADPYAGRVNLFRVFRGTLRSDSQRSTSPARQKERIGQLGQPLGEELRPVDELGAGDIGAIAKLKETQRRRRALRAARGEFAFAAARPARPGDGVRLRAEVQGRRGEGRRGGAPPERGGPDARRAPRPADRRADHRRPDPGPRRGDGRADEAALRGRDRAAPAARALPRVDPLRRRAPTPATRSSRAAAASSPTARSRSSRPRTAPASSSSTRSRARRSPAASSRRWRRGSTRRWSTARSPAIRSRTCVFGSSTASTTTSTPRRWPSRSPASMAFKQAMEEADPVLLEPIVRLTVDLSRRGGRRRDRRPQLAPRAPAGHGAEGRAHRGQRRGADGRGARLRAGPARDQRRASATTRWSSSATRRCRRTWLRKSWQPCDAHRRRISASSVARVRSTPRSLRP